MRCLYCNHDGVLTWVRFWKSLSRIHAFKLRSSPSLNEGKNPNDSLHPLCNSNNDNDDGKMASSKLCHSLQDAARV